MIRRSSQLVLLSGVLVALGAGCDNSGIHGLGRVRDALVRCDADALGRVQTTSTWLRSTDEGTEILLLGRPDPTTVVGPDHPACWGHGFIEHDSSTTFEFGSYDLDASGNGTAAHALEYAFAYQPDRSILSRDGSIRTDLSTPEVQSLALTVDGTQLLVSLDGEERRMTSLAELVESIDTSTQEGAEAVFRVFNLPVATSQARLLGFGSGSMTQYVNATAEFVGTIRNDFTVEVAAWLDPDALITYHQFEDLTGIVIDGPQLSDVDTSGNGHMNGVLSFIMHGQGGASDVVIRGGLDYQGLLLSDGVAAGGTYTLRIDGAGAYTISYELASNVDLRGVLPVQTP
jgi:hypothetical protein